MESHEIWKKWNFVLEKLTLKKMYFKFGKYFSDAIIFVSCVFLVLLEN